MRPAQRPATDGSPTITIHDSAARELHPADPNAPEGAEDDVLDSSSRPTLVLNLQGGGNDVRRKRKAGQRVVWKEDVIDNEGAGKKKSKSLSHISFTPARLLTLCIVCCIYHKPRRFDESSDESSGESDCEGHIHGHGPNGPNAAGSSSGNATASISKTVVISNRHSDVNAYEAHPHHQPAPPT
jgi:protein phosphatase 1 regulatory subunit 11